MLKKFLLIVFLFSLSSLLSCASKPPDVPLCVEIHPEKGKCIKVMSGETFVVDETHKFEGKTWWEIRPAMVQMPASTWVAFKAYIIKMCKKTNMCGKEVPSWDRSLETVDKTLKPKIPDPG